MIRKSWLVMLPVLAALVLFVSFRLSQEVDGQEKRLFTAAKVIATFDHDAKDFCQGLVIDGDTVLEGTGLYGQSLLKRYSLTTGKVEQQIALNSNFFGEGIAAFKQRIYQLTWKERVCVVYDKETFKPIGQYAYTGEGWGLTSDEKYLYMSNGSEIIQVLNPADFKLVRKIRVLVGRKPQTNLNELEFVGKELWACIWGEDKIARIDPKSGTVRGFLDCKDLYPAAKRPRQEDVLNGVAYDPKAKRLFVTGKLWPKIFEVAVPDGID